MKEITRDQYLQLTGLLTIGSFYYAKLRDVERAACAITGDKPEFGGHTGDALYSGTSNTESDVNELLRKLDITVADPTLRRKMKT